jgi:alcohol dehydrogenase (cytochrome c)
MKSLSLALLVPLLLPAQVTQEKLRAAQNDPNTWLMYGRDYQATRFSPLSQIDTSNVAHLAPAWIRQARGFEPFEATPLVFDGMMYVTGADNRGMALDLLTGKEIWGYGKAIPKGVQGCCGSMNRGFAALGNRLFKVNYEARIVALDSKNGEVLWETVIDDFKKGYSATVAPIVVKNLVVIGIAGAEFGTRGFVDAYDANTGKRVWRFYTVPEPSEPGGNTWKSDAWQRGGGSTWVTGSYDPELNLIYWGTGNPGPDMNGDVRPGDNLYTCSMIALDADTGKLKWHYQFTPHDVHDWDATEDPVLADLTINGKKMKTLLHANRNGFMYVLNRADGKFITAKPYTEVSWASAIAPDGKPMLIPGQEPSDEGTRACPGLGGGHNWQPTAFNPRTGLYYFGSSDGCELFYKTQQDYVEGLWYQLSTTGPVPKLHSKGSIIAVDAATAATKWRYEMLRSPSGGMLTTAGNLLITGDQFGYLIALDARTGKLLWKFQTGGSIGAGPISYSFRGRQYIAVAASGALITFALPQ